MSDATPTMEIVYVLVEEEQPIYYGETLGYEIKEVSSDKDYLLQKYGVFKWRKWRLLETYNILESIMVKTDNKKKP